MPKNIKYSDLFEDDGGIDKLIQKIKELETTYAKIGKASVKQLNAVKRATENLKTTDKDFNNQIKANEKQVDAVVKKMKEQEKEEKKLNNLRKKAIRLKTDEAKTEQALRVQVQEQTRALKQEVTAVSKAAGAYKRQSTQLNILRKRYKDLAVAGKQNTKEAKNLLISITKLDSKLKQIDATVGQSTRKVGNYATAFRGVAGAFRNVIGALGITAGLAGLARVVSGSIGIFASYEKQNSKLQAVLGVTKEEMVEITAASKELGATTAFTATEVAGLQTEYAKLGFPIEDILAMTESTLNAAAAMDADLGEAAKLTGATLKSFKLDASEAGRVNDVLAKSTSASALDFQKLSSSMSTIAPVAARFGFSLEGTTALLGELSNAGFDASTAATATRKILLNLADANGDLAKSLKEPVTDLPSLVRGLQQLKGEGVDLGKALELTDIRSVAAFSTFLEGTDSVLELNDALENAAGTAQEMADIQLDNLAGATTILNSAWEGFILTLEDGNGSFATTLKNIVRVLTELLSLASGTEKAREELDDYQTKVRDTANLVIRFAKVIKIIAIGFVAFKISVLATTTAISIYSSRQKIAAFVTGLFSKSVKGATFSFKALNTAMKANVIGLAISLITAAATAFFAFRDSADDVVDSIDDIGDAAEEAERKLKAAQSIDDRFAARAELNKKQLNSLKADIEEELDLEDKKQAELIALNKRKIDIITAQSASATKELNAEQDERKNSPNRFNADDIIESDQLIGQLISEVNRYEKELKSITSESGEIIEAQERILEIEKLLAEIKLKEGGENKIRLGLLQDIAKVEKDLRKEQLLSNDSERILEINELLEEQKKKREDLLGITEKERLAKEAKEFRSEADAILKEQEEISKGNKKLDDETKKLREEGIVDEIESEKDKELKIQQFKEKSALEELKRAKGDFQEKEDLETEIKRQGVRERAAIEGKFSAEEKKEQDKKDKKAKEENQKSQDAVVNASLDALDRIQDEEQKRLDDKIEKIDDQITRQEDLAKEGLANTLAFEEGERAKFELKKIESEKKAIRLEKVKALYAAYSAAASSGDDNAIVTVLRDFAIIQGLESSLQSFGDGTGEYGDVGDALDARKGGSKGGNSLMNGIFRGEKHNSKGGGGIPVLVEGDEGIWKGSTMGKFGKDNFIKLTQGIDSGNIGSDIFERQVAVIPQQSTMMGLNLGSLESKLDGVQKAIEMKPVPNLHAESISEMVSDIVHTVKAGKKTITSRYRINKRGL
tara:strand:+ start:5310 stop:9062 length:3753 start_codon:yes stop_codon:yes gene_type:complete